MDAKQVVARLKKDYPGKRIIRLCEGRSQEIICEIQPTSEHPAYSVAIAVVDRSLLHFHLESQELYEVMQGTLRLYCNQKMVLLHPGDTHLVEPGVHHFATGRETWVRVTSSPGWKQEDHYIVE